MSSSEEEENASSGGSGDSASDSDFESEPDSSGGTASSDDDTESDSDDDVVVTGERRGGTPSAWACVACTFRNDDAQARSCAVCETPREYNCDDDFEEAEEEDSGEAQPAAAGKKRKPPKKNKTAKKKPARARRKLGLADPMAQRRVGEDGDAVESGDEAELPQAPAPEAVTMPLLPFQKESLGWMQKQEASDVRGGILADEMGMGKTIQAINIIVANRAAPPSPRPANDDDDDDDFEDDTPLSQLTARPKKTEPSQTLATACCGQVQEPPWSGATLVVCPVAALMQWKHEIEKFVRPGTLSVYVYHGNTRTRDPSELSQYDVVLTTYSIVEGEFRRHLAPPPVVCEYCGDKFRHPRQLVTHLKYFCGPDAQRSEKQAAQVKKKKRKGTAAPAAALKRSKNGNRFLTSPEAAPGTGVVDADNDDDAVEAQGQPAAAAAAAPRSKEEEAEAERQRNAGAALHRVRWRRIILDEAHMIKDRSCSTAQGVFRLEGKYRWCLSGTPLQNRVGELYSLVHFLRLSPYAYYYCKAEDGSCDCKSLKYDFGEDDKHCVCCGHSKGQHYCWWNKHIANPIKHHGYQEGTPGAAAMRLLKRELLPKCLLRRTKKERSADIALPPRIISHRHIHFSKEEQDYYTALYSQTQATFNDFVAAGTVVNNYAHIFDLLIRLRQAVNHPWLVEYSATRMLGSEPATEEDGGAAGAAAAAAPAPAAAASAASTCGICGEECGAAQSVRNRSAGCGHSFCRGCLEDLLATAADDKLCCPACPAHLSRPLNVDMRPPVQPADEAAAEPADAADPAPAAAPKQQTRGARPAAADRYKSEEQRLTSRKGILRRINEREPAHLLTSSTKIEALLEAISRMRAADPSAKAICFSQFVNALDLIEYRLLQANKSGELAAEVGVIKLDGRMSVTARDKALTAFKEDPSYQLLLMSLKAGGVALNLTVANQVFLMDPWWNPAVEYQAMDRIHRLGQHRPMTVTRLFIANSIEDRILRLQEKKRLIFEGTVGQDKAALARLTEEDLRFLFS